MGRLLSSGLAVQVAADPQAEALTASLPSGASIVANLAMVLLAIVVAAWLVSRLRRQSSSDSGGIRVIASCALSHRDRVVVMAIGDEQIVVGVSGQSMVRLHELAEPLPERDTSASHAFANKLKRLRERASDGGSE